METSIATNSQLQPLIGCNIDGQRLQTFSWVDNLIGMADDSDDAVQLMNGLEQQLATQWDLTIKQGSKELTSNTDSLIATHHVHDWVLPRPSEGSRSHNCTFQFGPTVLGRHPQQDVGGFLRQPRPQTTETPQATTQNRNARPLRTRNLQARVRKMATTTRHGRRRRRHSKAHGHIPHPHAAAPRRNATTVRATQSKCGGNRNPQLQPQMVACVV